MLPRNFRYLQLNFLSLTAILLISILFCVNAQEEECQVCEDVLKDVMDRVDSSGENVNDELVRKNLLDYCQGIYDKRDSKNSDEERKDKMCFYIGAHKDSSASMIGDAVKTLAYKKPPLKVCKDLKTKDAQICSLKYDKPIDWDSLDLDKMRVGQLRELLRKLGDSCKGCVEKVDFVQRIRELMPKKEAKEEL
uniref:Mesencephalic astrocyte-derived neurotrophic factor homolog n=1 Tax=Meloidogyne enterolobii TaxID=390850 RepID=A0A6V7VLE6_MELEN|nr:unnamed protein product [Meloidogyne enterolobii]